MNVEELNIYKYIIDRIDLVFKEPRAFIKHPFIDPGSVYDGNVWDWDTYWSVYGLIKFFEEYIRIKSSMKSLILHSKGNVFNFLDHQLEDGYIPMMIELGQWDEPYFNKKHKEGIMMNMHKPFLCQQIVLISDL
jgi:putative isomerase